MVQQSPRQVNVKSYWNWARLSLFESWKEAPIKESISWITVIKYTISVLADSVSSPFLILLDTEVSSLSYLHSVKDELGFSQMSQSKPANILDQTKLKNLNSEPVTPSEVSHIPLLDRDIFTTVHRWHRFTLKICESTRWHQCSCLVRCCKRARSNGNTHGQKTQGTSCKSCWSPEVPACVISLWLQLKWCPCVCVFQMSLMWRYLLRCPQTESALFEQGRAHSKAPAWMRKVLSLLRTQRGSADSKAIDFPVLQGKQP